MPPSIGKNNPTASFKWLNKSSEIGTVSGRGIGRRDISAALIRDMECEQRCSLRANKICTPPAAGILILPLCRFNYCSVAALLCFSRALRGGQRFRRSTTVARQPKISSRLGSARNQNKCCTQTLCRAVKSDGKVGEPRKRRGFPSLRSCAVPPRCLLFSKLPLILTVFFF